MMCRVGATLVRREDHLAADFSRHFLGQHMYVYVCTMIIAKHTSGRKAISHDERGEVGRQTAAPAPHAG